MVTNQVRVEIIAIGDEVLFGQILNSNAQDLSQRLSHFGYGVMYHSTISDDAEEITKAVDLAFSRADLVLTTGGLGPTKDDLTKYTLAKYFETDLVFDQVAFAHVSDMMTRRGREINELTRLQAMQPAAARYVQNDVGTAPAMWFEHKTGKVLVAMPGVPFEMRHIVDNRLIEMLNEYYPNRSQLSHYHIHTTGIPESALAIKVNDLEEKLPTSVKLAYLPSYGQVKLRFTQIADFGEVNLTAITQPFVDRIGKYVFYTGEDISLEQVFAQKMKANAITFAAAESCTGGALAATLTKLPGASQYFLAGLTTYTPEMKSAILGIDQSHFNNYSVYSLETAEAMAKGVQTLTGAQATIGITGIAGPASDTDPFPVGSVWIAARYRDLMVSRDFRFGKERETNIKLAVNAAMSLLLQLIGEYSEI